MPVVLVDLLFLTGTRGGMESYARNLYTEISDDDGLEFVGLISKEAESLDMSWFPGKIVLSGIRTDDRKSWVRGELFSVGRWARRVGADLIHAPANIGPVRARIPVVLTVHDVLSFEHPEWVPGRHAPLLRWLVRSAARNAAHILTVSTASKAAIRSALAVSAEVIDVVPLAGLRGGTAGAQGSRRTDLVLNVGNRMPHKNVETLLRAVATLPHDERPRVAITGGAAGDPLPPLAARLGIADDVDFVGWVSEADLDELYASATIVAVLTRFEGFGLPVLEAMSRGCPVVCSDLPVLREVAGDAAVYVDPDDPAAVSAVLSRLLRDSDELGRMAVRGLDRAAMFSWSSTAQGTIEVFQRVLAAS